MGEDELVEAMARALRAIDTAAIPEGISTAEERLGFYARTARALLPIIEAHTHAAVEAEREQEAALLTDRANELETKDGRRRAQWHEHDAAMVAGELHRQATAIRNQTHRDKRG